MYLSGDVQVALCMSLCAKIDPPITKSLFAQKLRKSNNSVTDHAATGFLHVLNDTVFLFWFSFFLRIMQHAGVLYDKLQSRNANFLTVCSAVQDFDLCLQQFV
jgi:hypothetical protein